MEVSFILSNDELYTLLKIAKEKTKAGKRFIDEALHDAKLCDLSGLIEKKLARSTNGDLELEPVLRMVTDAISRATSAELQEEVWNIRSPWVDLLCENYPYHEGHQRITPVNKKTPDIKRGGL